MEADVIRLRALGLLVAFLVACGSSPEPGGGGGGGVVEKPGSPSTGASPSDGAQPGGSTPGTERKTDLFVRTFGDPKDRPIVFVHGGPGSNAVIFERTVAEAIAARGNFVVSYDQRGSGRSPKGTLADFTYAKATGDLDDVIAAHHLKDPILIGHSWGTTLALKYLELHPNVAKGAILVSGPLDYPESIFTILQRCRAFYEKWFLFPLAREVAELEKKLFPRGLTPPYELDSTLLAEVMKHALPCGLYFASSPTAEAAATWAGLLAGEERSLITDQAPDVGAGFDANEGLSESEFSALFEKLKARLYGIYGADDGLYSDLQNTRISNILGASHFTLLPNAGHMSFIDQRSTFLEVLARYLDALSKS
jgi:proline iminopeptidase